MSKTINYHKLANKMGLWVYPHGKEIEDKYGISVNIYGNEPACLEDIYHFETWLKSLQGRNTVKKYVKKEWCEGVADTSYWKDIQISIATNKYTITLMQYWLSDVRKEEKCFFTDACTEHEAFFNCAIWLANRE